MSPPELVGFQEGHGQPEDEDSAEQERHQQFHPSAPPPYESISHDPIIRASSLTNESFTGARAELTGSARPGGEAPPSSPTYSVNMAEVEMREIGHRRGVERMEEVPLSMSVQ